jgi:trimethylamine:corrinoid methyltransferase-like protein
LDQSYDSWSKGGRKDIMALSKEKVESVLRDHTPEPLDKDVAKRLDAIVKGFGKA